MIKCKNTAWRAFKHKQTKTTWNKFKRLRNDLQKLVKSKCNLYLNSLGDRVKTNPKSFWTFIKSKTATKTIPDSIISENNLLTDANEKAEAFSNYFHSVFNPSETHSGITHSQKQSKEIPELCNVYITEREVMNVLKSLDCSKSTGPDNVSPIVLKECCQELSGPLCALFNKSLSRGFMPLSWRNANVIPVYKSGNAQLITNYRPISLLSVVSKVFERCIYNKIYPYVSDQLYELQHGFIRGRSTSTQMLQYAAEIGKFLDNQVQVDIMYLDFAKAFDRVSHDLLLEKLRWFGFGGNLLNWFFSYLKLPTTKGSHKWS